MILAPYSLHAPLQAQFPPDKLWTYCERKFEKKLIVKTNNIPKHLGKQSSAYIST